MSVIAFGQIDRSHPSPRHTSRRVFIARRAAWSSGGVRGWNEGDESTGRIIVDPASGEVYHVEPPQVWDAALDWAR